ncbi:MAG TPA: hypothetical protein VEI97_09845 [bacterium]|nr:hypothetical protein [bacterium]
MQVRYYVTRGACLRLQSNDPEWLATADRELFAQGFRRCGWLRYLFQRWVVALLVRDRASKAWKVVDAGDPLDEFEAKGG